MSNCTNIIRSPLDNRKNQYISDDMLERGNRYRTESYKFYTTLLYQETRVPFFFTCVKIYETNPIVFFSNWYWGSLYNYSSIPDEDDLHSPDEFDEPEEECIDQLPVIGTCRALYTFMGMY